MTEPTPPVAPAAPAPAAPAPTPAAPAPVAPAAPAPTAPATPTAEELAALPQWARDSISSANREAAATRVKLREIEPKAAQFDALEQASKTEAQRLADAASAATRDAETARAEVIRYKVAAAHHIPVEDFDLLGSGTEEEITARAVKIAAKNAAQAAPPAAPGAPAPTTRPTETLRPGATPAGSESEEEVLYRSLFGADAK